MMEISIVYDCRPDPEAPEAPDKSGRINNLIANVAQAKFSELQADFNIPKGEVDMLVMDMPSVTPQDAPVLMQIAAVKQKSDTNALYGTMGVCLVSSTREKMGLGVNNSSQANGRSLYPQGTALRRFPDSDSNVDLQIAVDNASVKILQQPEYGTLKTVPKSDNFYYVPQQGYTGNDKVVFLVNIGGQNVKTVYYIKVVDSELNSNTFDALYTKYCPPPTDWIISSSTTDANSIASLIPQNWLSFVQPNITITFEFGGRPYKSHFHQSMSQVSPAATPITPTPAPETPAGHCAP